MTQGPSIQALTLSRGESPQAHGPHVATESVHLDSEVAEIADAWSRLPDAVQASLLMLVRAARKDAGE
jgi:hypothetical protein